MKPVLTESQPLVGSGPFLLQTTNCHQKPIDMRMHEAGKIVLIDGCIMKSVKTNINK